MQIKRLKYYVFIYLCTFTLFAHAANSNITTISKENSLKIVNASQVRIRSAPNTDASVVNKLAFGTLVNIAQRTKNKATIGTKSDYWYYLAEHKAWIFGQLLTDFQPKKAASIQSALVAQRLKKSLKFTEYVELSQYIKSILKEITNRDIKGSLELNYLISLEKAAEKIEWEKEKKAPYATFLKQNKDHIFYAELAGQYIVGTDKYWELSKKYADSSVGDAITWYAVNAMSGGECEGMTYCMIMRALGNEGEYLRRYPKGKHHNTALKALSTDYQYVIDENFGKHMEKYSKEDQQTLRKEENILYQALEKMDKNNSKVEKLYQQLKTFDKLFFT